MINRKVKIALKVVGISVLLTICIFLCLLLRYEDPIREFPKEIDVQNGDILLLGSSTLRGRILKMLDWGTSWLHVGLADVSRGEIAIIHADPIMGTVRELISDYLLSNHVNAIAVLRPIAGDPDRAVAFAREMAKKNAPFDNRFRYKSGKSIYCTELVLLAWESGGCEILSNVSVGASIKPSQLFSSPNLTLIWQNPRSK